MLPREWEAVLEPMPGTLLVRLDRMPERQGEIFLPPQYRDFTRTTVGEVFRVGEGVSGFAPGDRVMLADSIGRRFDLGEPPDVLELWRVSPWQVMLRLKPSVKQGETQGESPLRNFKHGDAWEDPQIGALEGEPRALR